MHSVGRQDAIEMLACRDAELDEPLVKVVLDRSAAGEQLVKRQSQLAAYREAQPEVLLRWFGTAPTAGIAPRAPQR